MKVLHVVLGCSLLAMSSLAFGAPKFGPANPEQVAKGKALFAVNCAVCHGPMGAGDGVAAAAMNPKPRNLATEKYRAGDTPEKIFATITNGLKGTSMAAFGHLPEEDRKALTYFIRSLRKK